MKLLENIKENHIIQELSLHYKKNSYLNKMFPSLINIVPDVIWMNYGWYNL